MRMWSERLSGSAVRKGSELRSDAAFHSAIAQIRFHLPRIEEHAPVRPTHEGEKERKTTHGCEYASAARGGSGDARQRRHARAELDDDGARAPALRGCPPGRLGLGRRRRVGAERQRAAAPFRGARAAEEASRERERARLELEADARRGVLLDAQRHRQDGRRGKREGVHGSVGGGGELSERGDLSVREVCFGPR
jgi:hypothetical protein